jgi:DNA-binding HxlR family transcriptional regulator
MVKQKRKKTAGCPVETTLKVIDGRWKVLIIHHLLEGTKRFGELTRALGSISARTLSKQLRELAEDGVIDRKDFGEIPPRVEYSVSTLGTTLKPVLKAMEAWGQIVEKQGKSKKTAR